MRPTTQKTSTQLPEAAMAVDNNPTRVRRGLLVSFAMVTLAIAGFAGAASAMPVAVTNAGFEYPAGPVGAGGVIDDVVDGSDPLTGWTKTGGGQIYNPGNNANAPEGSNSYLILDGISGYNLGSGSIEQTLGDTLKEGTYTLSVEVGENATSSSQFGTYSVELGVDIAGVFTPLPGAVESSLTPVNQFLTSTVIYTAAASDTNLGQPLAIRLVGAVTVPVSGSIQVLFDNVRLDFIAAPHNVSVFLQAQSLSKTLPVAGGDITVPMWGFVCDPAVLAVDNPDCVDSAAGPQINAFPGMGLTINLTNTLATPISIVIPGQAGGGDPVPFTDGQGRARVQSFTHETGAGATTAVSYSWSSLRAGTYLYQSGTHPSIQVPMGLHGALVVGPAVLTTGSCTTGQPAYDNANSCYDAEAVLLFSEIDPVQNAAVAAAGGVVANYPSTVDYNPTYMLVNGEPSVTLPSGNPSDSVLLRLLNAGLRSHTPSILGLEMGLIAEDGNLYPGLTRWQSHALLPAGKTLDVVAAMPAADVTLALFDRMPTFTNDAGNENSPNGGGLANLQVGGGSAPPTTTVGLAVDDTYAVPEDCGLTPSCSSPWSAPSTVLANDDSSLTTAAVVSATSNGTLVLASNGTFTYTPIPDFSGSDSFTYSASDGTNSYTARVTLNVSFVNDAPVAAADAYVNTVGGTITVAAPGVLGNDADPDGDTLTAVIDAPAGFTLNPDGSFTYSGPSTTFTYNASDDGGVTLSDTATVTLTINPASNIALTVQDPLGDIVTDYRWTLEEDTMWQPDPGVVPPPADTLATNFHKSYMPIVAQGCVGTGCPPDDIDNDPPGDFPGIGDVDYNGNGLFDVGTDVPFDQVALDPAKNYYVSVLPADAASGSGHTIGGARIPPATTAVTVNVNNQPLPDAQISVYVFEDSSPTNGAVDGAEEVLGLGGFQITLEEAGGRYGISGGAMLQDANGDPLQNSLDCFGSTTPPRGVILTCPNTPANIAAGVAGEALIKNLYPGKYGIITTPPVGEQGTWTQTSTIEGSKVIDAWVKAGEPPFFQEFGPGGWHAFVGFVNPANLVNPGGDNTVTGNVTNLHMSRPPLQTLWDSESYDAFAHTRAWVGLNSAGGTGPNIAAVQAEPDGSFTIPNVPDGLYQLVVWDAYLDQIIAYRSVALPGGGAVGNMPVFNWFTRTEHNVFHDVNQNGVRDPGEAPLPEQAINLRWRDGTVNQSFPTDLEGFVPFDQTFPFFNWQVLEVDYTRFKATGLTVTVDGGGDVSTTGNILNPQIQADGNTTRTEIGPVLTQGFQGFLGQTSIFDWGKAPYAPGENGGISGIVYYPTTRAENDPRLAAAEPWEPGIPGVKVRLYREVARASSSIAVTNAGFELPVLANGALLSSNPLPGWTKTGGGQIFNPGDAANAAEGVNNYLILNNLAGPWIQGDGSIEQTLGDVLQEGSYSLSVAVGENVTTNSVFGNYQVQLGVMNGTTFVLLAEDDNTLAPVNQFLTSTVGYTAAIGNPYLGLPLVIRLVGAVEGTAGNTQVLFDDVRLDFANTGLALVQETVTDSWDNSLPTGCPGADVTDPVTPLDKCYDGLRNFNQARPAVFDGGYAFNDIPAGKYIVEVVVPPGYDLMKEEDNNVSFGDVFANAPVALPVGYGIIPDPATVLEAMSPEPGLAQPPCVGAMRKVPLTMSLFPAAQAEAPFAGSLRPLCDRKEVILSDQGQAAADFFLFTGAPIAGHIAGMVLDDLAQEFSIYSPQFGEKWAPPFVPVSIRDHNGKEISRIVSDQWGRINGLVPSTFTANAPSPSGYSPAMYITCMNDPGPIPDPNNPGQSMIDPQYNPAYSNFCYTFQYMPGTTTYLDTPVLPVSAFASGYNPVDCALDDGTPMISSVNWANLSIPGPWARLRGLTDTTTTRIVDIRSAGRNVQVPNPAYEGPLATGVAAQKTILRDFDFGTNPNRGTVTVGGIPLTILSWNRNQIRATIEAQAPVTGELVVTRGDNGKSTVAGITFTISADTPLRVPADYPTIQAAIDAAAPGALILVAPGFYDELVIMWKPVRLQGAGAGSTFINAVKAPGEKIVEWRTKIDSLFTDNLVDALPTQPVGAAGFGTEEGAAITVLAKNDGSWNATNAPRIDGFSITGGDAGGGIFVNGYAHNLEIANNNVFGNNGLYSGGIRVGRPFLQLTDEGPFAFNTNVNIHHNTITQNGGLGGAGGGLSIATGTDDYTVSGNFVCGNFTTGDGGGIGHLGLSDDGMISDNHIVFNQSFAQATTRSGGGLFIAGEPPVADGLTYGSGSVTVDSNLIQGNHAGAGHGGGIRTQFVNGRDIPNTNNNGDPQIWQWYLVTLNNNMIVNNVAGWSGGGVSLADTARSFIVNNTIAHNDSTATVSATFTTGDPNISANQPAGISSEPHSAALIAAIPVRPNTNNWRNFSNPFLRNNILWQNRSFHYEVTLAGGAGLVPVLSQTAVGACDPSANYSDLGVLAGGFSLNPRRSVLTDTTGYPGNTSADPGLVNAYCNGGRTLETFPGPMQALPALDEGGAAWIDVRYGPLTQTWPAGGLTWDYHIGALSSAIDYGRPHNAPSSDFDGDTRPLGNNFDAGADELQ